MNRTFAELLPPADGEVGNVRSPLEDTQGLLALLRRWVERGWLRALDRAFVEFLSRLDPQAEPLVLLAAAFTSHQLGHGHVCLDLGETLVEPDFALSLPPEGEDPESGAALLPSFWLHGIDAEQWRARVAASRLVALPADDREHANSRPLVLCGQRLYLRRYWGYERKVDQSLRQRLSLTEPVRGDLRERLDALFGEAGHGTVVDWQKLACALAVRGAFSIVTGGPGTGKTTTVVRLLALLQAPAVEKGQPLRIRLAAPTGKAAARLTESISLQVRDLRMEAAVRERIPCEVTTLHRLLGSRPGTRHFRHNAGEPLPLDVLVVDEASMVDLEMMANLLDALPPHARLVLLGDKDQLASVEAGAVLGDLCRDAEAGLYTPATQAWLASVSGEDLNAAGLQTGDATHHGLAQQVAMLRHSRRFDEGSGIGRLARLVNGQQAGDARRLLAANSHADLAALVVRADDDRALQGLVLDGRQGIEDAVGYRHYLGVLGSSRPSAVAPLDDPAWTRWARDVLKAFDAFQLLCAVRKGPWGVEGLNQRIGQVLTQAGLVDAGTQWYEGRPVLMTRNDYGLGLMNGDIGIALRMPETDGGRLALRVAFPRNDGSEGVRLVLPSRLGDVETVYAMTVHKSQGSEFAHTALVLPEAVNPVLTKELVYTGITRARNWFSLVEARKGVFEEAVQRKVKRLSGLMLSTV